MCFKFGRKTLVLEDDVEGVYDSGDILCGVSALSDLREDKGGKWKPTPRIVRRMLMQKSAPQPRSRKTPRGGRMMAMMILQMSLELRGELVR